MDLRRRVEEYIEDRSLLEPGARLVLGVSGGPDSLCLLDLLHALAGDWGLTVHVAHLNHGLRPEAAAEAEFVRAEAEKRKLAFHTDTVDTRSHARPRKQSIEEAARDLRYAFLARVARAVGAATIAVAHTADDQAETVLMHILRGSGLAGLRGMLPHMEMESWGREAGDSRLPGSGLRLIRPLLAIPRAEVEAYCAAHGLHPMQDATNLDTTYFRNRLRHELLPALEAYNPSIRAVLWRTAEVLGGEHELVQGVVEALWKEIAQETQGRVTFERARWLKLAIPEQRRLLREAVARLRPDLRNVSFTPVERALRFSLNATPGRGCDLLGGLRLSVTPTHVIVGPWGAGEPLPDDVPLLLEDGLLAPGWRFCAERLAPGAWSLAEVEVAASGWRVYVDAERVQTPLRLRARLPGDRFQPLGMGGHSAKVSDFMINLKVAEALRDRWPLVVGGEDIVWVVGLRLDERFKVTPTTREVLRLSFAREGG